MSADWDCVRILYFKTGFEAYKLVEESHDNTDVRIKNILITPELVKSVLT